MAPRLRLNITKPLPTICETHEELQEDLSSNARSLGSLSTNSDLCSSEDYLQSICQLARPTFPAIPENHPRVRDKTTLQEDRRCPKPAVMPRAIPKCQLTNIISNIMSLEKVHLVCEEGKPYPCSGDDPLEKLYAQAGKTHHYKGPASSESLSADYSQSSPYNTSSDETHLVDSQDKPTKKPNLPRIFSFPRLPSPGPVQREDRFPELKSLKISERSASGSDQTQKENCTMLISGKRIWPQPTREKLPGNKFLRCSLRRQYSLFKTADSAEKAEVDSSSYNRKAAGEALSKQRYLECFQVARRALIHNWISECKCAWKEAKVKACLLPAIAEV
ncbi:uncharacterized protein LOC106737886 [Alligator mississippiensis]|uniref:uncharacterized protein LOC106737886 n=1 Tax=Alligator mississippiensis TaxID=8496 RepID=UPI000711B3D1|nr:uncharacterized protein LOC106737886 [Alligator mississippiensis]XP_059568877.1 uncharacterized protein LOC106737886 [Alligator mississippiensis]XP_059568878.1 uncharacterized protein LOC106737886 [Alligator mississippiensis]